jgi:hypothetical protein
MSTNVGSIVVGVFRDQRLADQARAELRDAGFTDDQIHASGAGSVGSFLKSLFTGQAATSDSFRNELANMGIPDEEAQYYTDEYKNGNSVIAVEAPGREQEARSILQRNGAYDYHMTHQPVGSTPSMQQARANMPAGTADANRNVPPPNMPAGTADSNRNVPPPNMPPQPLQRPPTPPPTTGQRLDQEQQKVADETTRPFPNSTSTSTPPRTDATPVAQQTTDTNDPQAQIQALQAQYQRIQQQLHDAQVQLQAAKQRESQLQENRQRESEMHALQRQMQEAQMQLQSTMAELQATEARIASQYNQSQQ